MPVQQPSNDLVIGLIQVRQNGVEFDFCKVSLKDPQQISASDLRKEPPTVEVKITAKPRLGAAESTEEEPAFKWLHLDKLPDNDVREINWRHEDQQAYAADALRGIPDRAYSWMETWRTGVARITHRVRDGERILFWKEQLEPKTEVVLDFSTRRTGGKEVTDRNTRKFSVYVEDGFLPRKPSPTVPRESKGAIPEALDLRTSEAIQGNVLAGFNKSHQVFLCLGFSDEEQTRQWLGSLLPQIAHTSQVTEFNDQFKAARERGDPVGLGLKALWVNVAFTYEGIRRLVPDANQALEQHYPAFCEGPIKRAESLGDVEDSAPVNWVVGRPGQSEIHALLTIAADDVEELRAAVKDQWALAHGLGLEVIYQQRGDALPDRAWGHEHFGFKDGVSQPGVEGYTRQKDHPGARIVAKNKFLLGSEKEKLEWMEDGSFQVFRRLAQDVPGWWAQLNYLSRGLPIERQMPVDLLAAKLVGRWPSGTPLELATVRDFRPVPLPEDDEFTHETDAEGHRTPLCAHTRKMHPRTEATDDDKRRILRRGIPFGAVFNPAHGGEHGPNAERGLLFNAFMADIDQQFEYLQKKANSLDPDGPDPLVGVPRDGATCRLPALVETWNFEFRLRRHVRTTGAIYAFAPSLRFLEDQAKPPRRLP
jgi:Dyp-type peroxidase family